MSVSPNANQSYKGSNWIAAAAHLAGKGLSSALSFYAAKQQMKFQERMSGSAHQREVKDLRKAGLNPILSANKGASSPSGAMANVGDLSQGTADAIIRSRMLGKTLRQMDAQWAKTKAEESSAYALANKMDMDSFMLDETTKTEKIRRDLMKEQINEAKALSKLYAGDKGALIKGVEKLIPALGLGRGIYNTGNKAWLKFKPKGKAKGLQSSW